MNVKELAKNYSRSQQFQTFLFVKARKGNVFLWCSGCFFYVRTGLFSLLSSHGPCFHSSLHTEFSEYGCVNMEGLSFTPFTSLDRASTSVDKPIWSSFHVGSHWSWWCSTLTMPQNGNYRYVSMSWQQQAVHKIAKTLPFGSLSPCYAAASHFFQRSNTNANRENHTT